MRRLIVFLLVAFVLCACGGQGGSAGGSQSSAPGASGLELVIQLPAATTRDILAQTQSVDRVEVSILQAGSPVFQVQRQVPPGETTLRVAIPPLFPGTFTVLVEAYSGDELVAEAEEPFSITPGVTTTVTLLLEEVGLVVTPASVTLTPPAAQQLTATRDGVPVSANWMSDNANVATVDATGLVMAVSPGTASITATEGGETATAVITVTNTVTLDHIEVTPATSNLNLGGMVQLTATAFFSDLSTQNVTNLSNWNSLNMPVAMVNSSGLVTAVAPGTAMIEATFDGQTDTADVQVSGMMSGPLAFLLVSSPTPGGGGGSVTSFEVAQDGTLSVVQDAPTPGRPLGFGATSDGQFVYVSTALNRDHYAFAFDTGTGMLSLIAGPTTSSGVVNQAPQRVVVDPTDTFVYFTTFFAQIGSFTIGLGGIPTLDPTLEPPPDSGFYNPVFNSAGNVMYVPGGTSDTITVYDVNQTTGALSYQNPGTPDFPVDAGDMTPEDALVSSDGNFLFVANNDSNNLRSYPIGPGGALMNGGSTVATDTGPRRLALHPLQGVLYVATDASNTVQAFTIGVGGSLTPLGGPLPITGACRAVLVDPSGQYLYSVASGDTIDAFTLGPAGELTFDQSYGFSELSFPSDAILIPAAGI